ncbi:hypothetical protein DPMN_131247 [Dreissena polymorpha]|uniref:Uncharacterized protein n=1 Tax=Dreissena polymorpha TaxID=45954 RepID=A0A9D4H630_DREPO|nr:hypothetical protein DPMN_131247 [Dreissena polymorpha]
MFALRHLDTRTNTYKEPSAYFLSRSSCSFRVATFHFFFPSRPSTLASFSFKSLTSSCNLWLSLRRSAWHFSN